MSGGARMGRQALRTIIPADEDAADEDLRHGARAGDAKKSDWAE
jgi:hypothetical protein